MIKILCSAIFLFIFSLAQASETDRSSWVLVDAMSTGVIKEHNSQLKKNPGDLVQLMTVYTVLQEIKKKNIDLSLKINISQENLSNKSNLRRIYVNQNDLIPLETLLNAVMTVGAEDAALTLSAYFGPGNEQFAKKMNDYAKSLGMNHSFFSSPIADSHQVSTAFDLSLLAMALYKEFPSFTHYFSQREFTYQSFRQINNNLALWKDKGIDGMFVSRDGKSSATTWHRPASQDVYSRRIFSIILDGEKNEQTLSKSLNLLRTGRSEFESILLFKENSVIAHLDVLQGNRKNVEVGSETPVWVTITRKKLISRGTGGFSTTIEYEAPLVAPIKKGTQVANLIIHFEDQKMLNIPLVALYDVSNGSFFSRFMDSILFKLEQSKK